MAPSSFNKVGRKNNTNATPEMSEEEMAVAFQPTGPGRTLTLLKALERSEKSIKQRFVDTAEKVHVEGEEIHVLYKQDKASAELQLSFTPLASEGGRYLEPTLCTVVRAGELDMTTTAWLAETLSFLHRVEKYIACSFFGFRVLAPKKGAQKDPQPEQVPLKDNQPA